MEHTPSVKGAMMRTQKFKCRCQSPSVIWREQAPDYPHRYRIECERCEKFFQWGSADGFTKLVFNNLTPKFEAYKPPAKPATLDEFFE